MLQHFSSAEIQYEKEFTIPELFNQLMLEARHRVQHGHHPPTVTLFFKARAEAYYIENDLTLEERNLVLASIIDYVRKSKPTRVCYVVEEFMRHTPVDDPYYDLILKGQVQIETLPGTIRVLSMTVQDPNRHWQHYYRIENLSDGTRYPGNLILGQDPYLPAMGTVRVGYLFYGPPADTARHDLN